MKTFILNLLRLYKKDNVRIYSSSATFYIIVSSIPFISILFYFVSYFSPQLDYELEGLIANLLPSEIANGFSQILNSIKDPQLSSFVPFSIITIIWSSTKGVGGLCHGIEEIYGLKKDEGFFKSSLKTIWRTLLVYLVITTSLLALALGKIIYTTSLVLKIIIDLRLIIFVLALTFFFTLFYSRLSNKKMRTQLFGGLFSALGWTLFTYFYSIYISYALSSVSIYAEMGTIIFFMLWCYFCVNIILIGAEVNKILSRNIPAKKECT